MLTRPKLGIATWIFGKRPLSQTLADIAKLDKVDGVELAVDIDRTFASAGQIAAGAA
jgi:sugar phosphate isomerase/epimerase